MTSFQSRRQVLTLSAAALASTAMASTWAQQSGSQAAKELDSPAKKPYDIIKPAVASDANRVRLLFSYDCPHCRSYHNGLTQWGATLPKPFRFEATPIIANVDNSNLALAVYGRLLMQGLAPEKTHLYDYATYTLIQGDADTGVMPKAMISIDDVLQTVLRASGASGKALKAYVAGKGAGLEKRLPEHAELIKTYGLTVTPSVAIGGKIVINPDHANSNPQQFLLLLNGMVSRIMQGGPSAI